MTKENWAVLVTLDEVYKEYKKYCQLTTVHFAFGWWIDQHYPPDKYQIM